MEKNLKRSLSILLSASLLSTILPFREAVAASNAPSFTGVYQKDDHVKLEWAVDMNPSDILSNTSYESGQEQPNLLWGWTGAKTGNQSIVKGSNGTNVVKLTDTYTNRAGNWFNYPNTDADSSIHLYKGKSVPAGSTLSLSFKAKMTGGTTGMLYSFITTGWFKKGYERRDDNGRIIRFAEDVDFNNPPEEFSAYVDGGTLTMQDTSLVVVSSHGTNYDYGVIYYDWNNSKKKFVKGTSGTGVWNNPSPTGQPMTMRKDVFRVGEPLLVYREQPSHFPTRWMNETQNNQWVTYSSNVYISENTDYDFVNRGVLPYIVWATDGTLELDDFKLGYATEVEVFRDSESIYRGYLADYEDYAATDKAKPNVPSNVKVTMGSDRKARVTWDAATDRGTTYNYTIKGYPKNASETLVSIKKPVTVTAEIKGYSLVIDQNPSTIPTANITTTSTGYTMPTVVNGNFYVHIAAVDNKNNISSVVHIPYVDTTNPTINISPSNESWTSESIELTAVASDGETGVKRIKLPDGTWANHATASYSVTQNGTYTFVAEDNAGNQTEYTYTVSNIDKTAPTIQITPQSRSWSEEDIQIKIQYADAQSGINPNKRQYKVTTSPEMPTDWDIAAEDEQFLTIHNEGTWYIHAKTTDRVGYETTITTERLQLQEQPAAPDLQAYGIGENSATLEWAVPAASTYTDGYRYTVQNLSTGQSWEVEHPANSFVDSSLSGGNTYQYQVVVTNHVGQSVSNPIEITTLPEKPSSVQVSKDGRAADRALVNISPVDSASSYRIVATETATQQEAFNQTVTDTVYQPINNLRPGSTYDIAVSAINATGEGEATHVGFLTLPDTPAGFSGLEITEHTISLLWNSVNTATYYALERDEQLIYGGTEPSYLDTGLESGTSYDYRVAAENETGYGEYATIDDVITLPARVEGIRSLASTTSDISFEWDAVRGADGYLLTINGGEEIQLPAETQQFTASGLESGSTYEIQVTASNRSGSGQSNSIVLSTLPDAPAEVLVQEIGEQEATVWIPEVQGATKYLLSVNGRTYETSSGEMVITGLSGGQNYPFTVAAGNMAGYGAATSGEFLTLPYMPNNVQAESTDHSIEMSWDAVPSATSYVVYDSHGQEIEETHQTSITMNGLSPGRPYDFQIAAVNGSGTGKKAAYTYWTIPGSAEDIKIEGITEQGADISFEAVEGATYYKVSVNGKEYIRETPGLALIDLKPGTTYEWAVQAGNTAGEGRSTTGSFLTLPGKVDNLSASATEDAISMRWDPVKSATSYKIYDAEMNLIEEVESVDYTLNELQPGTDYTFILEAINASGTGQMNSISYVTVPSQPAGAAVTNITEDAAEIRIPTVSGAVFYEVDFEGELYTLQEDMLQLTALEPGVTYQYSVAAGNQAGKSKSYVGEFTTLPDTVLNLSAQPLDSKRVRLEWSPVKSADYYQVYNAEGRVIETASDPAIIIEQLNPGTSYEFSVGAVNGSGEGKKSTVSSLTIPDKIADLTIGEVTESEASLSFESVTGATYYTLNVNNIESRIASDQQEIELKHLTPGTKYSVGLAAGNESGQGEKNEITFFTLPEKPAGVRMGAVAAEQATVIWDEVESATRYQVVDGNGDTLTETKETRATLSELEPGQQYDLFVRAENASGYSQLTPISFRTQPAKVDVEINVDEVTTSGAKISWDPVPGVDGYKVYLDGELVEETSEPAYEFTDVMSAAKITGWSIVPYNEVAEVGTVLVPDVYTLPSDAYEIKVNASKARELTFDIETELKNEIFVLSYRGNEVYRGQETHVVLDDLMHQTTYSFEAWSENEAGDQSDVKTVVGTTLDRPEAPVSPPSVNPPQILPEENGSEEEEPISPPMLESPFEDIDNSWAKDQILKLYELGIVKGTGTQFEPARLITRIEFVSLLVRALQLETDETIELTFHDTNETEWYAEELKIALANQVVKGFSETEFRPKEMITREQASKMLANALYGPMIPEGKVEFTDVEEVSSWARSEVIGLGVNQLVQGYPDGTFKPKGKLTRAESAAMIYRMYDTVFGIR